MTGSGRGPATATGSIALAALVVLALLATGAPWLMIAAAVAAVGFFVLSMVRPELATRLLGDSAPEDTEIGERADRQHRWAALGDSRGVYGPEGAELMDSVMPKPDLPDLDSSDTRDGDGPATIAHTADGLAALLAERPPSWRWAVFGSVLVQRRDAVRARLRDHQLDYALPSGVHLDTGAEVWLFVTNLMADLSRIVGQLTDLVCSPAFTTMFGDPADERTADADTIVHAANRMMDLHDQCLGLAEDCRGLTAPDEHTELLRDCRRMIDVPLAGYRRFIDDYVRLVDHTMPEVLRYGRGTIDMGEIALDMEPPDGLMERIGRRLDAIG